MENGETLCFFTAVGKSRENVQFKQTMNQNTHLVDDNNGESYYIGDGDQFFDVTEFARFYQN